MPKNQGIKYMLDFEALATTIGALEEAAQVANTDRYIGKLITAAHAKMADEFDAHLVADAMASGAFNHMFEWGTAGINKGRTTRRINPMSQEAKLWEHMLVGTGKNKGAAFRFLPSKVPVPQPTTTQTGISQQYLSKLGGKHIFWNKAAVMEAGTPVHIAPKNGGKLFIPIKGYDGPNIRPADKARGFIMTSKPVTVVPGGQNVGTFTAYWEKFWEGFGSEGMEAHMQEGLESHLESVQKKAQATHGRLAPAGSSEVAAATKRGRALGAKVMMEEADTRARKRDHE